MGKDSNIFPRDSFMFYRSFSDAINELSDKDGKIAMSAVCAYALDGEEPQGLSGGPKIVFTMAKPQIDANTRRYANGCNGGAPKGSRNNPDGRRGKRTNQELTENKPNDNVNDNDNTKRESIKRKCPTFSPPSLEEIQGFITEQGYTIDPQRFLDFYAAKGWMIGKNKMKDWQAAVRTWAHRPDHKNPESHEAATGVKWD